MNNSEYIPGSAIPRFVRSNNLEKKVDEGLPKGLRELQSRADRLLSKDLPENPYSSMNQSAAGEVYRQQLAEYELPGMPDKADFIFSDDPNAGWKLHLNVTPENVKKVSEILSEQGFRHKYLKAGTAADGKVFTIYIGSRRKAEEEAMQISNELKGLLSKPVNNGEVEFAEGVVGRFTTKNPHTDRRMSFSGPAKAKYHHYGSVGLVWLAEDMATVQTNRRKFSPVQFDEWYSTAKPVIEQRAYMELSKEFGDYFSG